MAEKEDKKSQIDFKTLKAGGFMKQKQPNLFSLRLRIPVGNVTSEQLSKLAEVSKKYGKGYIHLTTRQGIEIPYVHFDKFASLVDELATSDLGPGSCGPRVRNVVACPGETHCPHGLGNTQAFGKRIDKEFFGRDLPCKIKIAVTGCPNSCAKPQENDIGFMAVVEPELSEEECINCGLCAEVCPVDAIEMVDELPVIDRKKCIYVGDCITSCPTGAIRVHRQGWNVYVGGKVGKQPQLGKLFKEFVSEDEGLKLIEQIIKVFSGLAEDGERLGSLVARIGLEKFREEVLK